MFAELGGDGCVSMTGQSSFREAADISVSQHHIASAGKNVPYMGRLTLSMDGHHHLTVALPAVRRSGADTPPGDASGGIRSTCWTNAGRQ